MKYVKRTTAAAATLLFVVCLMHLQFFSHPQAIETLQSNLKSGRIESGVNQVEKGLNLSQLLKGGAKESDTIEQNEERGEKRRTNTEQEQMWNVWVKERGYVDIGTIWTDCDNEIPETVGKITLSKDDRGLKYNLDMNATVLDEVSSGKIFFEIERNGAPFRTKYYDICETTTKYGWDVFYCPIKQGPIFFHYDKRFPRFLPSGEYYGESNTTDQLGRTILCGKFNMKI